jgi:aminoglycoside phosphotransferase (APT) family kinase protein
MTTSAPAASSSDVRMQELASRFERWWCTRDRDASDARVAGLQAAPSGFSNETWFFDLEWKEHGRPTSERLVVRMEPQGPALFDDCDLDLQYDVMQALGEAGIAVPGLLAREPDPSVLGAPFFVMEFVPGAVASGRRPGFHGHGLFFDASLPDRRTMWLAAVEAMAAVHGFDWNVPLVTRHLGTPADCAAAITGQIRQVEGWLAQAASLGPFPVLERALAWLRNNPVDYGAPSFLWGDARPGNLIYQGTRVAAILDWEMAGIGPAEFDLFHFLLTDEVVAELNSVPRLAGLPDRAETIAAWEGFVGRKVRHPDHAEIFAALRFAALLALVVRLTPAGLDDPRALLTDNFPTRRLDALLSRN